MGVSNLKKIIDYSCCCEEVNIEKVDVIIDGAALYYFLYFKSDPKLDQRCGGDYPGFKDEVSKFFQTLRDCGVTPYVILDGASDPDKKKTCVVRLDNKLRKAKKIADGLPDAGDDILPPLIKDVFIEILGEEHIKFEQCLEEADPKIISLANEKKCAVLSGDTDFCIYDVHNGFLHLDNFLWKNKMDGKIPAKLYKLPKFCEYHKLDPALMPVFASIAGNDYSELKEKDKFADLSKIENPSIVNDIKILDGMLWFLSERNLEGLSDLKKRERALSEALTYVGKKENQPFKLSIQKYIEVENREKYNSKLPSLMRKEVKDGKLTTFVISVVDQKTMMLTPLVEDFSQQSSYTAASRIRQYFYGLLTEGNITEYDRDGKKIKDKLVSSIHLNSDKQNQLKLLKVQTSDLKNIPDHLKLPVCVTDFWFKRVQHPPNLKTVNCLHALLLWFLYEPSCPEDEFEKKMKALKDEGVSNWQPHVAHAFTQWQCCMKQSLHLNQLLHFPLPKPQCVREEEFTGKNANKCRRQENPNSGEDPQINLDKLDIEDYTNLVIGDSVLRNVKLQTPTTVQWIPEARAGDIEAHLQRLAQCSFEKVVIHVGSNHSRLNQSEFTTSIESVWNAARTISDTVAFSGALPNRTNNAINNCIQSLNCSLSEWCLLHDVGFLDNWLSFCDMPGVFEEDGIHLTLDGAALLSRRLDEFIQN
ncbi:hypothetical protein ACER0C_003489 [Sarotherodon galilaeus]